MTKLQEIYKCNICGNIVEIVHTGDDEVVCCGQEMELQIEKIDDVGGEKHVPVIETVEGGVMVKVGSVPHPMEEKHYIEWVEILADGKVYRQELKPGDEPVATFKIVAKNITAREYCNIHGLWKSKSILF